MSIIDHRIKDILHHFRESGRLNVLIALISHANVRNRCYPSMRLIAKETGYALEAVNEAKKWLEEHGAIEIVKYQQRVGDEKKIKSPRQNVYQLTGVININGKEHPYLYVSPTEISESETLLSEISPVEMEVVKSVKIVKEEKDSTERKKKDIAPTNAGADVTILPVGKKAQSARAANAEKKLQQTTTPPHSARPPTPAGLLADALGLKIANGNGGNFGKVASALIKAGITCEEFVGYVTYWRERAKREKWSVTLNALTGGVRMSEYVTWRDNTPEYARWLTMVVPRLTGEAAPETPSSDTAPVKAATETALNAYLSKFGE